MIKINQKRLDFKLLAYIRIIIENWKKIFLKRIMIIII